MTKLCRVGHAQRSGNVALIPLSFQVAHSLSSAYHLFVSLFTQSSDNPSSFRDLPTGTMFVGAVQHEIKWVFLNLIQNK